MTHSRRRRRTVVVVLLAIAAAIAAYGFTATNTVPGSNAGDGSGVISGYTVSSIAYQLNSTDPSKIDGVTFSISPAAATQVRVQLVSSGGAWFTCSNAAGSVTCPASGTMGVDVASADQLRVVATS
jgi:hypothetical protein